jgi:mRNA interferase MazF
MPDMRDIYTIKIYYKGRRGKYKTRPVLILEPLPNEECNIVEITTAGPKKPPTYYDQYKEKIDTWKECGLNALSYVKCTNIHIIENHRLIKKVGVMSEEEFEKIVKRINEI